jgi:EAL domain-containing protein (putative c-di-GMP-specific phosphodiesterase class I)
LELDAVLRHAVQRGELRLAYQPIVVLGSGRISGVEALVRWAHPRRGELPPASFIPIAEETGLIIPLGRWVLREACEQGARWRAEGMPLAISVNLSARQVQDAQIVQHVAEALAVAGLPPELLVLEITESTLMSDTEAMTAALAALKALGVRLAIDDFGTGYSSLSYLQRFPLDILKIDRSFTEAVGRGGSDVALARTIVSLGELLSLRCVAEGIEQPEQRETLAEIGCALGQGFHFAHPLDPASLARMVRSAPRVPPREPAAIG